MLEEVFALDAPKLARHNGPESPHGASASPCFETYVRNARLGHIVKLPLDCLPSAMVSEGWLTTYIII